MNESGWLMLWFAFLGGIILNIMPCVFPILSLKVIGLTNNKDKTKQAMQVQGIMYTLGIVFSLLVLGRVLVLLKSFGNSIGWGYQLQSPFIIALLIYLFFLIGLNLSGVYEIQIPGFNFSLQQDSLSSHFFTGVLATIVATPCSAPFMATALGVALVTPSWLSLGIFIFLGLGLAFPYLFLCFVPGLAKRLPKPGQWMINLKEFLAFPMYLTVIWLLFVFVNQVGMNGLFMLLVGLVAVVFAVWLYRRLHLTQVVTKAAGFLVGGVLVFGPLYYAISLPEISGTLVAQKLDYNIYSKKRLDLLLTQKQPVFVYATADWCLTCKVNERVALNTQQVRNYFEKHHITVLKADWTKEDPAVTAFLKKFDRSTVPLYVFFPANHGKPKILPQLLTPSIMLKNLS